MSRKQCLWSKDNLCQTIAWAAGRPLQCDGHHNACAGRCHELVDIRDRPVQLALPALDIPHAEPHKRG